MMCQQMMSRRLGDPCHFGFWIFSMNGGKKRRASQYRTQRAQMNDHDVMTNFIEVAAFPIAFFRKAAGFIAIKMPAMNLGHHPMIPGRPISSDRDSTFSGRKVSLGFSNGRNWIILKEIHTRGSAWQANGHRLR